MRGNRLPRSGHGQISRSIPASAGEPAIIRSAAGRQRVYPRECGGTPIPAHPSRPQTGLSPRVRGNRSQINRCKPSNRSIPASAGEPTIHHGQRVSPRVYPRECGGTYTTDNQKGTLQGLSPRVRGNPPGGFLCHSAIRSIPASAGEPNGTTSPRPSHTVYPRECGGTWGSPPDCLPYIGLSPRVRGNLSMPARALATARSIPASAGLSGQ